tara:strand:+ start:358 stop:561 length:204 start_codon:yes stop_codon:yes gene_type:complete
MVIKKTIGRFKNKINIFFKEFPKQKLNGLHFIFLRAFAYSSENKNVLSVIVVEIIFQIAYPVYKKPK